MAKPTKKQSLIEAYIKGSGIPIAGTFGEKVKTSKGSNRAPRAPRRSSRKTVHGFTTKAA